MAGENARVETRVCGENSLFWVENTVNGFDANCPIHSPSMEHAEEMAPELGKLIEHLYRRAYRDGYAACRSDFKGVLGIR